MKTSVPKAAQAKDKRWLLVNAEGKVLGRLAARIVDLLRGKHKTIFSPHMDLGDHVILINAGKIKVTGRKMDNKYYLRHSGYPGHLKARPLGEVLKKHPDRVLREAIYGMLPKNKLRKQFIKKLHVYQGAEHQHQAQNPVMIGL